MPAGAEEAGGAAAGSIEIYIETLMGLAFEMTVSPNDTIGFIKQKIQRVEGEYLLRNSNLLMYKFHKLCHHFVSKHFYGMPSLLISYSKKSNYCIHYNIIYLNPFHCNFSTFVNKHVSIISTKVTNLQQESTSILATNNITISKRMKQNSSEAFAFYSFFKSLHCIFFSFIIKLQRKNSLFQNLHSRVSL